jgi:pimeloyl-ACP methyl ester carboxylesterase
MRRVQARMLELEEFCTPEAFLTEMAALFAEAGPRAKPLIEDNETWRQMRATARLETYRAERLSEDVTLYRGAALWRAFFRRRGLLVCVTGRVGRMQVSTPAFLQAVPGRQWDVLMLRDREMTHYRRGCKGFGDSLPALAGRVAAVARAYRGLVVMGSSMGGLAALRLSLALPPDMSGVRAVSFGGQPPLDTRRMFTGQDVVSAFDPLCACLPKAERDMVLIHSGAHQVDKAAAEGFAALVGGVAVPVPEVSAHATLAALWRGASLRRYLGVLLDSRVTRRDLPTALLAAAETRAGGVAG